MRNKSRVSAVVILTLVLALSPLTGLAQDQDGSVESAGTIFQFGTDAKSLAMGGSFVAVADNYSATYWNPAGLSQVKGAKLGGMNLKPYDISKLNFTYFGGAYTFEGVSIGGAYGGFNAPLDDAYQHTGQYSSYSENMFLLSTAFGIGFADIGANVKRYSFGDAAGYGFDVGILASFNSFRFGLSAADIGGSRVGDVGTTGSTVDPSYRLGAAFPIMDAFLLSAQLDLIGDQQVVRAGMEIKPFEQLALRAGVAVPGDRGLSISGGAGLSLAGLQVDVAWVQNNTGFADQAGNTLVLSAGFQFGAGQMTG